MLTEDQCHACAKRIALPPRQLTEDLTSVQQMALSNGHALGAQAEIVSEIEWSMDQGRAAKMRAELALSSDEHAELLGRFRSRNEAVWGPHSRTSW